MPKKSLRTPRSRIRQALRALWLRSRERAFALKSEAYTCEWCKRKQSVAKGKEVKMEVHHPEGIGNWDKIIDAIYKELLISPDKLAVICADCHKKVHGK